jgi:hypothetical protein
MLILLRLGCATLSAFIFVLYLPIPSYLLFRLADYWGEDGVTSGLWCQDVAFNLRIIAASLWMLTWACLEFRSARRVGQPVPKLLTHLRYGPIAILVFSVVTIIATDLFLIQYSKWQLVRWIHSDAAVTETPPFRLHNNYRHWCGNGMSANEYDLYGATPAAYIDDPDPAVRARALQASMYVYDWLNNPYDGPSITALRKASADSDPTVSYIAAQWRAKLRFSWEP